MKQSRILLRKLCHQKLPEVNKEMKYLHGCIHLFSLSPVPAFLVPALVRVPAPALFHAPAPFLSPSLGVPGHALVPVPSPNWQQPPPLCEPNGLWTAITQRDTPRTHIKKTQRLMVDK